MRRIMPWTSVAEVTPVVRAVDKNCCFRKSLMDSSSPSSGHIVSGSRCARHSNWSSRQHLLTVANVLLAQLVTLCLRCYVQEKLLSK
eukprot:2539605-Amphidinium_carterae.1